ncbi:MAG TPA: hypothetical protein VG756_14590 [Pseudonocardiaceae bacterium]|nr:hypothetical protein [Pseudonocardiaceae bacterium]
MVTERAVTKHIGNIFRKLDLPPSDNGHRRMLAYWPILIPELSLSSLEGA